MDAMIDTTAAAFVVALTMIGATLGWLSLTPPRAQGKNLIAMSAIYGAAQAMIVSVFLVAAYPAAVAAQAAALVAGLVITIRVRARIVEVRP